VILLIDNYDSFTYNLYQMVESLGYRCVVKRNDAITLEEIELLRPQAILLSPGPGYPCEAGITLPLIRKFSEMYPIFGVCLGHQAIGEAFGGKVVRALKPKHGKISPIFHQNSGIFESLENPFEATRYHSLVVERSSLPSCLEVTCETQDGLIMGLKHRTLPIEGVQFHPESVATMAGSLILKHFLDAHCSSVLGRKEVRYG
jgi:anthranilate synthase/aminodeoxychorismate synthase-like glutamine amidotransferase